MVFIDLVAVELRHRAVFVHSNFKEWHPSFQPRLMGHNLNEFQLAMWVVFQVREKIGQSLIQINESFIV